MSKSMEEFIKENGTYDEKEGSYSFACSEADVKKEGVSLPHEVFGIKVIMTERGFGINAYFDGDELEKTAKRLKISKNDIMEFGNLVVKSVEEELQKLRRKIEFASSVDIATKVTDMFSKGCSMEEIYDFIVKNTPGELPKEAHKELKSILSQFF